MKVYRKMTDTGILTEKDIMHFCENERQLILNIAPVKEYVDYVVCPFRHGFRVICSYRQSPILKYFIDPNIGVDNMLENFTDSIKKYICLVICKSSSITKEEIDFLSQILSNMDEIYLDIFQHYYNQLPEEIQEKFMAIKTLKGLANG